MAKTLSGKALETYRHHMAGFVQHTVGTELRNYITADVNLQVERFNAATDTMTRDLAAQDPNSDLFATGHANLMRWVDQAPVVAAPDKEALRNKINYALAMGNAMNQARRDPASFILSVHGPDGGSAKFAWTPKGMATVNLTQADVEKAIAVAHEESTNRASTITRNIAQANATQELFAKQTVAKYTALMMDNPDVLISLAKSDPNSLEIKALAMSGDLFKLMEQADKIRSLSTRINPTVAQDITAMLNAVDRGQVFSFDELNNDRRLSNDQIKEIMTRQNAEQNKLQDRAYAEFNKGVGVAVDSIKAWANGKNPINNLLGIADTTSEMMVAEFHEFVRQQREQAKGLGKDPNALNPHSMGAAFQVKLAERYANTFKQDADKMIGILQSHMDRGDGFTSANLLKMAERVRKDPSISQTEKNHLLAIATQLLKQTDVTGANWAAGWSQSDKGSAAQENLLSNLNSLLGAK